MRPLVASATLLVLLAGCSWTTGTAAPTPTADSTARFLQILHLALPDASDTDAISIGEGVCTALDKGHTLEQIAQATMSTGIDEANDRAIIQVSVLTFCPQYSVPLANWTS